jgi:hypothetical protein
MEGGEALIHELVFPENEDTTIEISIPRSPAVVNRYALVVHNPSEITDLKVNVYSVEALGDALAETITVPKKEDSIDTHIFLLSEAAMSLYGLKDVKLKVSNASTLGAGQGFTAKLIVRPAR